jgi:hypothetical protein
MEEVHMGTDPHDQRENWRCQFLLEEYKKLHGEAERLWLLRLQMGVFLLGAAGVVWALCLREQGDTPVLGVEYMVLLPAIFGIVSLGWIIRYSRFVNDKSAYMEEIIERWFGVGQHYLREVAERDYGLRVPPVTRFYWTRFFVAFPFQHVMIWASIAFYLLLATGEPGVKGKAVAAIGTAAAIECLLLWLYYRAMKATEHYRSFWREFRAAHGEPE